MKLGASKLSKQHQIVAGVAILAALFGWVRLYCASQSRSIDETDARIVSLRKEITEKNRLIKPPGAAARPVERYLASNNNFSDLLKGMASSGLAFKVNKIAVERQESFKTYTKTQFALEIDTSFPTLGQFIEQLEKSKFLVEIDSIEVSRISEELKKCSARIKLSSYVARE